MNFLFLFLFKNISVKSNSFISFDLILFLLSFCEVLFNDSNILNKSFEVISILLLNFFSVENFFLMLIFFSVFF